jgi:hypothetical protein
MFERRHAAVGTVERVLCGQPLGSIKSLWSGFAPRRRCPHRAPQALVGLWRRIEHRQELRVRGRADDEDRAVEQFLFGGAARSAEDEVRARLAARLGGAIDQAALGRYTAVTSLSLHARL